MDVHVELTETMKQANVGIAFKTRQRINVEELKSYPDNPVAPHSLEFVEANVRLNDDGAAQTRKPPQRSNRIIIVTAKQARGGDNAVCNSIRVERLEISLDGEGIG